MNTKQSISQPPELLARYLHAVGKRLPDKGREDILRELESDILERLDQQEPTGDVHEKTNENRLSELLTEFGDPETISRQYGGRTQALVGADLFPSYVKILRLVLAIVLPLLSFVFLISLVFSPTDTAGITRLITDWIAALFQGAMSVFATVTISFAIAERVLAKSGARMKESEPAWTPAQLPFLPDAADRVKPAGLITGILFTLFAAGILLLNRDMVGVILKLPSQDKPVLIPLFNEQVMTTFLWALLLLMSLSVVNAVWKLAAGRFTRPTRMLSAVLCFAGAIVSLLLFNRADLMDPTRGLSAALSGEDLESLLIALRLSLRITSAAIAIPLLIEGVGHIRQLLRRDVGLPPLK